MIYLADSNVLREATQPQPKLRVLQWLRENEADLAVDPIVLGEIRYGIYILPQGSRRRRLEQWFLHGVDKLRCISWDGQTAHRWAKLLAEVRATGQSMPFRDSLIAATALVHGLTVATRNARDFQNAGVRVVNPFTL